jgi:hypothetical protein
VEADDVVRGSEGDLIPEIFVVVDVVGAVVVVVVDVVSAFESALGSLQDKRLRVSIVSCTPSLPTVCDLCFLHCHFLGWGFLARRLVRTSIF